MASKKNTSYTSRHAQQQHATKPLQTPTVRRSPRFATPSMPQASKKEKRSISIAGVLKHSKKSSKQHKKNKSSSRKHQQQLDSPDPPSRATILRDALSNGLQHAHDTIENQLVQDFESTHTALQTKLQQSSSRSYTFLAQIAATTKNFQTPLTAEVIQTSLRRDGEHVPQTVDMDMKMGQRVDLFREMLEREREKLAGYWRAWDEMQREFVELGAAFFGAAAFENAVEDVEGGFKNTMKGLDEELEKGTKRLGGEIDKMARKAVESMRSSEKEQDATVKQEQTRLLQEIYLE